MYCTKCGAYLPEDAQACSACGTPIADAAAPGEPVPPKEEAGLPKMETDGQPALPDDPFAAAAPAAPLPGATGSGTAPQAPPPAAPSSRPAPGPVPPYQAGAYQIPRQNASAYAPAAQSGGPAAYQPVYQTSEPQGFVAQETPVTMGEWVVTLLLCALPVVNIIMLFVWAFGGGAKASKRNWARAALLFGVIAFGVVIVFWVIIVLAVLASGSYRF